MPNRIIKESICRSDSIDSLSWFEEVLFYRLIVVCDDYGRFDGRTAIIRGACFPLKDMRLGQIEDALKGLATAGMIRRYETEDGAFLQLTAWERHQQIRAKNSKYPAPEDEGKNQNHSKPDTESHTQKTSSEIICNQMISDDSKCPRESRIENRESKNINTMCDADAAALFERLWKLYPCKKGKGQVSGTQKKKLLKIGFDEMSRAIERYLAELRKDAWRKPQNGSTFFNSGYVDYLDANYSDMPHGSREESAPQQPDPQDEPIGENENWMDFGPDRGKDDV